MENSKETHSYINIVSTPRTKQLVENDTETHPYIDIVSTPRTKQMENNTETHRYSTVSTPRTKQMENNMETKSTIVKDTKTINIVYYFVSLVLTSLVYTEGFIVMWAMQVLIASVCVLFGVGPLVGYQQKRAWFENRKDKLGRLICYISAIILVFMMEGNTNLFCFLGLFLLILAIMDMAGTAPHFVRRVYGFQDIRWAVSSGIVVPGLPISKGHFGEVKKGSVQDSRTKIAIKEIRDKKMVDNEIEVLYHLSHPNVVKFYGYDDQHKHFLYFQLEGKENLAQELKKKNLSNEQLFLIAKDVACGMSYIHQQGFRHNDLKPANILLDEKMRAKVSDFGLSSRPNVVYQFTGTIKYLPPEVKLKLNNTTVYRMENFTWESEVYSYGICLWQMYKRDVEDFPENSVTEPDVSPIVIKHIMKKCLEKEIEDRPSFCEIVKELEINQSN